MANTNQASPQKVRAILKQIFGEKINEVYQLTGPSVSIGRNPKCHVKLDSLNVSRRHCILTYSNNGWKVKDNKSRNGTYVNGRKLEPEEDFLLQFGDIVFLGPPSEMPQAFSYQEIFEPVEDLESDDDIIELPINEQNIEIVPQKTEEKYVPNSDIEILECKEYNQTSGFACHSKDLPNHQIKKEIEIMEIPEESSSTIMGFNSQSLACISKSQDCSEEISQISTAGSDHGGISESLLNDGIPDSMDYIPSYYSEEHWNIDGTEKSGKRKRKSTENREELERKLSSLSEQIKALQQSKMLLLKDYEDACEKNKKLDQELADKEKKLEDLQEHEMRAKNELKSELLERLEEDLVCNICTELFIKPTVLDCSHTFCEFCIKQWRKKKNDCPICRCPIKSATHVRTMEEFIDKTLATLTPEQRVKRDSVIAQRFVAEQPSKPARTLSRRRRNANSRRNRYSRPHTSNSADTSIQILDDGSVPIRSQSNRIQTIELPGDELNVQVRLPMFDLQVLQYFFA